MGRVVDEVMEGGVESHGMMVGGVQSVDSIMDSLATMIRQEREHYPPVGDYLELLLSFPSSEPDPVSENWRRQLCQWCYDVSDHFHFDREVVSIALNYLDRAVAQYAMNPEGPLPKRKYQLLAVTSLYLAIKLHGEVDTADGVRRKLKIDAFYQLSRNQFDVASIEETERYLLDVLKWNVNPPTALRFIASYLGLCPNWEGSPTTLGSLFDIARYLTELSVCQSEFAFNCHTSAIAYAAVLCAIDALRPTYPLPVEAYMMLMNNIYQVTGYSCDDPTILTIKHMLKQLCPTMFEDTYQSAVDKIEEMTYTPGSEVMSSQGGKKSPVCVVEDSSSSGRKRDRS